MPRRSLRLLVPCSVLGIAVGLLTAAPADDAAKPYAAQVAPASDEGQLALRRIRVPAGFQVELFAAEPLLANPVAFTIDHRGRFFVAETFRLHAGVTDIRGHMDWLDDDLACRTVADRLAMLKKHTGPRFADYGVHHDRVRLIEDTDGDGKADRSTVFADGFHSPSTGIGAGLLTRGRDVWYACIPDLWRLRDTKGTGRADERRALQHGYGVRFGFIGHDLHGLRFGPDGKLYFSIGDRGLHVETEGRTVSSTETGAVLRCNPDGSELEIVATGLRNPQELVFDQYGNLFTGDNNSDAGDKARLVWVVEGGDSGWRIGYQFIEKPVARGPWNAERLWDPDRATEAAYLVPPTANVADGPSGLTYDPGLGLPERYRDHFFLCDFRGGAGQSGIRAFAVRPKGASFEMVDQHEFVWSVLATDADFGYDGCLYLTDWVDGWGLTGKGRIYRVFDPKTSRTPAVQSMRKLMAQGLAQRSVPELLGLLEHPDQRVRLEAQFTLAERGETVAPALVGVARSGKTLLARLHALWGLGQLGRQTPKVLADLVPLVQNGDAEVRAQAAKLLGDHRVGEGRRPLEALLQDPSPRVRFFAALALGKLGQKQSMDPVLDLLRANADRDAYLRHAGVMALVGINDRERLLVAAGDTSPAVRLAVLVALRRLGSPDVVRFLNDADPRLVLEAARAINDVPIPAALPQLAALIQRTGLSEPLGYRVLNAHFRLGQPENARAVAAFAARPENPERLRVEALAMLGDWARPSGRDRVLGLWRPLEARPARVAPDAVRPVLSDLFRGPEGVRREAARLMGHLDVKESGSILFGLAADKNEPAGVRVEALRALDVLASERLDEAVPAALASSEPDLRTVGRRILAKRRPKEALPALEAALANGTTKERQGALAVLGSLSEPAADTTLSRWLDRLAAGQVPAEMQLDLLEAVAKRSSPEVKRKLTRYEQSRASADALARYREALAGGDAEAGRRIFLHKAEVYCLRCHKVKGEGGEVGPDLTGIGARQKREYLLESIVDPNKEIAKGFETTVLVLSNGQVQVGIVKEEDDKQVRLVTAEAKTVTVPKSQIEERSRGKSAMPEDLVKHLTKAEVRDLVEFLAGLK
jgi:quinoprotein glucose dehydrogenase